MHKDCLVIVVTVIVRAYIVFINFWGRAGFLLYYLNCEKLKLLWINLC